jgi:hypothetical protein
VILRTPQNSVVKAISIGITGLQSKAKDRKKLPLNFLNIFYVDFMTSRVFSIVFEKIHSKLALRSVNPVGKRKVVRRSYRLSLVWV